MKSDFLDLLKGGHAFDYWLNDASRKSKLSIRKNTEGKRHLLPIANSIENYTEDDLFDVIEFIHHSIKRYVSNTFYQEETSHQMDCDEHYKHVCPLSLFINEVNNILSLYQEPFELSLDGEIIKKIPTDFQDLIEKDIQSSGNDSIDETVNDKINAAISRFRDRKSDRSTQKEAVRHLADILESLKEHRPKALNNQDRKDLFEIINNFEIRHCNKAQNDDYPDECIDWMFYVFLSTIHLYLDLISSQKKKP